MLRLTTTNVTLGVYSFDIHLPDTMVLPLCNLSVTFMRNKTVFTSEIEAIALFLEYCTNNSNSIIIKAVFNAFCKRFGTDSQDIHVIVSDFGFNLQASRRTLKAYYSAWTFVDYPFVKSALFSQPECSLLAVFGGHHGDVGYFSDIVWMFDVYFPLLKDYVAEMSMFLERESQDKQLFDAYPNGLSIYDWLQNSDSVPNNNYLLSAPVSFPLIGFAQLMQIMVLYKTLGITPGQLVSKFKGLTGHSLGSVTAVFFSLATDEESYYNLSCKALGLWMLIGTLPHIEYLDYKLSHENSDVDTSELYDTLYPMLSVHGCSKEYLADKIIQFNQTLSSSIHHVQLSLVNAHEQFVVGGLVESIAKFADFLKSNSELLNKDMSIFNATTQSSNIKISYISMAIPYHWNGYKRYIDRMIEIAYNKQWNIDKANENIPVYACDGSGLDICSQSDITKYLVNIICVDPVDWPSTVQVPNITHQVYFGSGDIYGLSKLTYKNIEGRGIPVICASPLVKDLKYPYMGVCSDLHHTLLSNVVSAPNWVDDYKPHLVCTKYDNAPHIDTKIQSVFGLHPLMIAGTQLVTASVEYVADISNAGYHIEFGASFIDTKSDFVSKLQTLAKLLKPGKGITINVNIGNQKQWKYQYPEIISQREKGLPIIGISISGNVPPFENAVEIITTLQLAGLRHISFSPANVASILQVEKIAKQCKDFPVCIQWIDHQNDPNYSVKIFHQSILKTYSTLRLLPNVVLIVGSTLNDTDKCLEYLTGEWSAKYRFAPMPFDGLVFVSKTITYKDESLLVNWLDKIASHSNNVNIEKTNPLKSSANKLAIHTNKLYNLIQNSSDNELLSLFIEYKNDIITALNNNHVYPWFGKRLDGSVVDLKDMTYADVVNRLVELLYNTKKNSWVSEASFKLTTDFIIRTESRIGGVASLSNVSVVALLYNISPIDYVKSIVKDYPTAATLLLTSEDILYFISMCKQIEQTQLPFIPIIDKDYTMQILAGIEQQSKSQGPVLDSNTSATLYQYDDYSKQQLSKVAEHVKKYLTSIYLSYVDILLKNKYNKDKQKIPKVEYIGGRKQPIAVILPDNVQIYKRYDNYSLHLSNSIKDLPSLDLWLQAIAGPCHSWLYALLTSLTIVRKSSFINNFVKDVMQPRPAQMVTVYLDDDKMPYQVEIVIKEHVDLLLKYDSLSRNISLSIFQPTLTGMTSLDLDFLYHPEQPISPIHMDMEQFSLGVHKLYAETWVDNSDKPMPFVDVCDPQAQISTNGFVITKEKLRAFHKNVGSRSGWNLDLKPDQKVIIPAEIVVSSMVPNILNITGSSLFGYGQLSVVVLYSKLHTYKDYSNLKLGDHIRSVLVVDEIINILFGRQIKVTCTAYSGSMPISSLECALFSRNNPADIGFTFQNIKDRKYSIKLASEIDIAVLESKEWFSYCDTAVNKLFPTVQIDFCLDSHYRFKSENVYSSIKTCGKVYLVTQIGKPEHIGNVDFTWGEATADPVIKYLKQHELPSTVFFEDGGYYLKPYSGSKKMTITTHNTNIENAHVSGDFNPIHTNQYIASVAGLPDTIVQGVWLSAAIRSLFDNCVVNNQPERVINYRNDFIGMVLPGDKLTTTVQHIGMVQGRMLIKGQTINQSESLVLECTAEVEQPLTAYVFTGQGSQVIGMGMVLYEQSSAARSVWDTADAYMLYKYGISILDIVKINPKELTVYFGGSSGESILQNYLSLQFNDTTNTIKLFSELNFNSSSYTFNSPTGLLNATQFTQVALVINSMATIADMKNNGLVPSKVIFAGHSLGEYAAILSLGKVISLEDMIDIVFCRGMIMQSAVERDNLGNSQYGMIAVNPLRVGTWFNEILLRSVILEISKHNRDDLIEVVNYNVHETQYIVAGTIKLLNILQLVLDKLSTASNISIGVNNDFIALIVNDIFANSIEPKLVHGIATIPLANIEIPFHSSILKKCIPSFYNILTQKIAVNGTVDYSHLCGCYIPNLTGIPFEISLEYFQLVHMLTGSSVIGSILDRWFEVKANKDYLAATLMKELLAYQFASPVQWIETQKSLIADIQVNRLIEIGTSPVLSGMASKTLKRLAGVNNPVSILHIFNDKEKIYYLERPDKPTSNNAKVEQSKISEQETRVISDPVSETSLPSNDFEENVVQAVAEIPDVPLVTIHIIHAMVAHKIKQPMSKVSVSSTIKNLVGGKSTLQNEIVGDLQKEFGSKMPERVEEMTLQEIANCISSDNKSELGKHTQSQISRLFSTRMPGGFTIFNVQQHLQTEYGLGTQRQDAVLLVALTMEPSERLANKQVATTWLDSVVKEYAQMMDISFIKTTKKKTGDNNNNPVISSAAIEAIQKKQNKYVIKQIEVLSESIGLDIQQSLKSAVHWQTQAGNHQAQLDQIYNELGNDLIDGTKSIFSVQKARTYDSSWNWSKQYAYEWIQEILVNGGNVNVIDTKGLYYLSNCSHPELLQMLSGIINILEPNTNPKYAAALKLVKQIHATCLDAVNKLPVYLELSTPVQPQTTFSTSGAIIYSEVPRNNMPTYVELSEHFSEKVSLTSSKENTLPLLHICKQIIDKCSGDNIWTYDSKLTSVYAKSMKNVSTSGLTFSGKTALVTGCGKDSIGADIVCGLLSGGAQVVATYYSHSRGAMLYFENLYRKYGAKGSKLIVVQFNQGSTNDIKKLIDYIYGNPKTTGNCLGWDLDYVFPFAAVTDNGSYSTNLGSRSEFAQRAMLTNVLRLLGAIKTAKEKLRYISRPSVVILPLSPNHGQIGGDGLYGECKIGLEVIFNRWKSESWKGYLSIIGAVIGWTRGTGLMNLNNIVSEHIEKYKVYTFSTRDMAFAILSLLDPYICYSVHKSPIWVDISGGLQRVQNIDKLLHNARNNIQHHSGVMHALAQESVNDNQSLFSSIENKDMPLVSSQTLAKYDYHFPAPINYKSIDSIPQLEGMINLDKVVVITGYGEIGPYGNSETRWEMETFGQFSMAGCIELALIMGLIKHFNGIHPLNGELYVGWVDSKTNEPVSDINIKPRYEAHILAHTGIRLIEPKLANGYDPNNKYVLREIQIQHKMEPFETSAEMAAAYKKSNGDKVDIWESDTSSGMWNVQLLEGALINIAGASEVDCLIAALIPTGWDITRFGLPESLATQIDPITHFTLVATVEALVRSGITDPYELYKYVHVSEVGNTTGSTVGGMKTIQDTNRGRMLDKDINVDSMQENFISTVQSWINMLLMSGSGPVKPVNGACATAAASIDAAVESIQQGKAKFMIAGGVEDFSEVCSVEFSSMKATCKTADEVASGREPSEMIRPCTSSRKGFVEGQGASIVTLMSASMAIEMGAPIYGIVALSNTATDKQGRSVPAPGKGILTTANENVGYTIPKHKLSVDYRKMQLEKQLGHLNDWLNNEIDELDINPTTSKPNETDVAYLNRKYNLQKRSLQDLWANEFWKQDPYISPLRGALAVWGLDADDIGLASFHGTSTAANDKNESDVMNTKLKHIGRTPGHVLPVVCQKWLTGHSKAAAGGTMLNGILQSMRSGLIPGNRNADNIDPDFKAHDYLLYLSKTIQTPGIKAALLTSFGFGQVGAELLIVHPDYLFAAVDRNSISDYNIKLKERSNKSYRYWQDTLVGNHPFIQIKEEPPYTAEQEKQVLLDPLARAHYDPNTRKYCF